MKTIRDNPALAVISQLREPKFREVIQLVHRREVNKNLGELGPAVQQCLPQCPVACPSKTHEKCTTFLISQVNTPRESYFLIWEAKFKIWVSYLGRGSCRFRWQAHSGRFNYIWLNEVIHLKQFEVILKRLYFQLQRKPTQQCSQRCPTAFLTCSGLLDWRAMKLTPAAGWQTFPHSLTQIPSALRLP